MSLKRQVGRCPSGSFILYGALSTMAFGLILSSTILEQFTYPSPVSNRSGQWLNTFRRVSTLYRRLGKVCIAILASSCTEMFNPDNRLVQLCVIHRSLYTPLLLPVRYLFLRLLGFGFGTEEGIPGHVRSVSRHELVQVLDSLYCIVWG